VETRGSKDRAVHAARTAEPDRARDEIGFATSGLLDGVCGFVERGRRERVGVRSHAGGQ
jgi:hypothetical protein